MINPRTPRELAIHKIHNIIRTREVLPLNGVQVMDITKNIFSQREVLNGWFTYYDGALDLPLKERHKRQDEAADAVERIIRHGESFPLTKAQARQVVSNIYTERDWMFKQIDFYNKAAS